MSLDLTDGGGGPTSDYSRGGSVPVDDAGGFTTHLKTSDKNSSEFDITHTHRVVPMHDFET